MKDKNLGINQLQILKKLNLFGTISRKELLQDLPPSAKNSIPVLLVRKLIEKHNAQYYSITARGEKALGDRA